MTMYNPCIASNTDAKWMHSSIGAAMPVTLTIKQVPDDLAGYLRQQAAAARRSLQGELLLILEQARDSYSYGNPAPKVSYSVRERASPAYILTSDEPASLMSIPPNSLPLEKQLSTQRLSLDELWQRAHKLGASMSSESAALIRRDRDARHRH
jgi:hypothetical protein